MNTKEELQERIRKAGLARLTPEELICRKNKQTELLKEKGIVLHGWESASYINLINKSIFENSKASALKAMCISCNCGQISEVTDCTSKSCPLHFHRPYQK